MPTKLYLTGALSCAMAMFSSTLYADPFSLDISALYMSRHGGSGGVVVTDPATGLSLLDADDLSDNFDLGAELAMTYKPGAWGGQVRVLTFEQDVSDKAFPNSSVYILTNPVTNYGIGTGDSLEEALSTKVTGLEANGLYEVSSGIELFAGLRAMQLDETFKLTGIFYPDSEVDDWDVDNHMVGAHFGTTVDFAKSFNMTGSFRPMLRAGVGIFNNKIDGSFIASFNGVPYRIPVSDSATKTAYSFDLDLGMHVDVAQNVSLYGGYRLLYLNNVALGSNQVANTTSYNSQPSYTLSTNNVIFHGLKAGVALQF